MTDQKSKLGIILHFDLSLAIYYLAVLECALGRPKKKIHYNSKITFVLLTRFFPKVVRLFIFMRLPPSFDRRMFCKFPQNVFCGGL